MATESGGSPEFMDHQGDQTKRKFSNGNGDLSARKGLRNDKDSESIPKEGTDDSTEENKTAKPHYPRTVNDESKVKSIIMREVLPTYDYYYYIYRPIIIL